MDKKSFSPFEFIEHTGDIGVKIYGETIVDFFQNAGKAFTNVLIEDDKKIKEIVRKPIFIKNDGWERILITWLNELLYIFETEQLVFGRYKIKFVTRYRMKVICCGEQFNPSCHELRTEIKAVTYHQLAIKKKNNLWQTIVIFDV
ncbi:MAG: archease [bacterium]